MEQNEQLFTFPVETSAQRSLASASTWARFLAILGFVFIGLILILFAIAGAGAITALERVMPFDMAAMAGLLIVVVLIVCAVIGVLCYLLLKGANLTKKGIITNDQAVFNAGLASYRTYFMLYGILSVISFLINLIGLF